MVKLHALLLILVPVPALAQDLPKPVGSGTLFERVKGKIDKDQGIEGLLIDNAKGSVSAASLAGIDADIVGVVENVRDFALLVSAFDRDAEGFGLSITPARTKFPIPKISLQEYGASDAHVTRLIGSTTLSYAQGKQSLSGRDFTRRALSVATSAYWRAADDPVVVVANAKECATAAFDQIPDRPAVSAAVANAAVTLTILEDKAAKEIAAGKKDGPASTEIAGIERRAAAGDEGAKKELEAIRHARLIRLESEGNAAARTELLALRERQAREAGRVDEAIEKEALKAFNVCVDAVLAKHAEKWNRSRYSVSFATGSIKPTDGVGVSETLGKTLAMSVLYGFDGVKALEERVALALTVRRTRKDPLLDTLGSSSVSFKSSTLVAARISGGSSVFRGLAEASNAKSSDPSASERTFSRAVGVDYRVMDGLWLNLRYGKQRKIDGSGDETGSLLTLNYSPSALLGR
jgi:hypothetical protein